MPCPTGEEGTIARWHAARIRTPEIGSRWILGGRRAAPQADWGCAPMCRWPYSDSLRAHFLVAARKWPARMRMLRHEAAIALGPSIRERHRIDALGRMQVAREAREQWTLQRRWLARERRIERAADIKRLVQSSTDIVIAEHWASSFGCGMYTLEGGQPGSLKVVEWLRRSHVASRTRPYISLFIGQHEDSVARRWSERPALPTSGRHASESLRCIAFLGLAHDSASFTSPSTEYRILDGNLGVMIADPSTLARVRAAMRDFPAYQPRRCADRDASLSEFAGLTESDAAMVGVKLTPTSVLRNPISAWGIVLGCSETDRNQNPYGTALTHGWFPVGALTPNRYAKDYHDYNPGPRALPSQMKAFLDSLATERGCLEHHIDPADSVSLMLRRVVDGRERVFECTLDTTSFLSSYAS